MGSRGASSGIPYYINNRWYEYGDEYQTEYHWNNIKFVQYKMADEVKAPLETRSGSGRVYVTVNKDGKIAYISYYDKEGKKKKTIDLTHKHYDKKKKKWFNEEHVHHGRFHDEGGTTAPNKKEREMIDRVKEIWDNKNVK